MAATVTVTAGDVRKLTTASGQVFEMRAIVAKFPGKCFRCNKGFAKGTLVWWIAGTGSRHIDACVTTAPAAPAATAPVAGRTVATTDGPQTISQLRSGAPAFAPGKGKENLYGSARTRICRGCGKAGDDGECGLGDW